LVSIFIVLLPPQRSCSTKRRRLVASNRHASDPHAALLVGLGLRKELDLAEPGGHDGDEIFVLGDRAAVARGPGLGGVANRLGERLLGDDVRDHEAATRLQDTVDLPVDGGFVGCVVDGAVRDDHVGAGAAERERGEVAAHEADVGQLGWRRRDRLVNHRLRSIDADGVAAGTDLAGGSDDVPTAATAEVQQDFASGRRREIEGAATGERATTVGK
jgi:hypothetical protein